MSCTAGSGPDPLVPQNRHRAGEHPWKCLQMVVTVTKNLQEGWVELEEEKEEEKEEEEK